MIIYDSPSYPSNYKRADTTINSVNILSTSDRRTSKLTAQNQQFLLSLGYRLRN